MNFSRTKMFFTFYVLPGLRLLQLKPEGQKISTENLTEKLQN